MLSEKYCSTGLVVQFHVLHIVLDFTLTPLKITLLKIDKLSWYLNFFQFFNLSNLAPLFNNMPASSVFRLKSGSQLGRQET